MADNTVLNLGSGGDTVATEDIAGVKYALTKLYVGAHGVNGGAVAPGNPLPVSLNGTVPLPTGAATAAKQAALGTAGAASADVLSIQGIASMTPILVNGSGVTQPVSITGTVPLPTGAATAAKQPTLGTAGSAAGDVLSIQGVASMTPVAARSGQAVDVAYSGATALTPLFAAISASASGSNTLVALVAGKKIVVLKAALMAAGAVNATFKSSTTSSLTGAFPLASNGGVGVGYCPVGNFATVAGEALTLNLDAAVQVSGYLVYVAV